MPVVPASSASWSASRFAVAHLSAAASPSPLLAANSDETPCASLMTPAWIEDGILMGDVMSVAFDFTFMLPEISDRIIGIVGAVCGAVGVIASAYFYYRSKRQAAPRYALRDQLLLDPSAIGTDRFDIFFDKERVGKAVRRARVAVWNGGEKTIDKSDIATLDPPRLTFPDSAQIFTHRVSSATEPANGFGEF